MYIDNLKVYQEKSYQNGNYTLIKDNFDSLNNGDNWNSNRVDLWRIEGGTDWNGDLSDTELSIEAAVTGKENVLKLANTATDSIIRGGRGWSWDSAEFIQPGETVSFEFDIYAENNSKFMFGIVGGNRNEKCEEYAGNSALFFVKNDSTTDVYCASSQLRDDNGAAKYDGVYFARNAFNHVKIDYTLNEDVSTGTKDIVSITVENDLYGTTAGTFNMSSRYDYGKGDSNYPMLPSIP
ncbi:MAG: hypothetical protein PUF72_06430 [Clostridiales bacterium]|nr:hypothetical protein [Clostridiales bacterium]